MDPITLITGGLAAIGQIINLINSIRERARQNGELTPDQEAELDRRIQEVTSQIHWQPGQ